MSLFKTVTMQIRPVTGSRVNGKWTQTVGAATSFKGTFQPLRGKELDSLPEGRRAGSNYKVYSDLNFDTVTSNENPDLVELNGIQYEIIKKDIWQNSIIPHYKYIVQEKVSK
jgi:hypothetical protein